MIIPLTYYLSVSSSSFLNWICKGWGGFGGGKCSSCGKSSSSGSFSSSDSKGASFALGPGGAGASRASSFSCGGGTPTQIGVGSPFTGRLSGGATRDQVYGNSRIGSGYPYGGYGTFYSGRPFPFGFFPIYISPGYYGGDEYCPSMNDMRTGGSLSTAVVTSRNDTSQDSYYLVGDESSVSIVLASLVSQCGITSATVTNTYINGTTILSDTALAPHPEQVVQYYRASSFALALSSFNNSATLPSRAPASSDSTPPLLSDDTPLPTGINTTLLTCLNTTIDATVPLPDINSGEHTLTGEVDLEIPTGSVVISMFLFLELVVLLCLLFLY